jgi:hypothetical protein
MVCVGLLPCLRWQHWKPQGLAIAAPGAVKGHVARALVDVALTVHGEVVGLTLWRRCDFTENGKSNSEMGKLDEIGRFTQEKSAGKNKRDMINKHGDLTSQNLDLTGTHGKVIDYDHDSNCNRCKKKSRILALIHFFLMS